MCKSNSNAIYISKDSEDMQNKKKKRNEVSIT